MVPPPEWSFRLYVCFFMNWFLWAFIFAVVLVKVLGVLGYARKPTVRSCVRASFKIFLAFLLTQLIMVIGNAEWHRIVEVYREEVRLEEIRLEEIRLEAIRLEEEKARPGSLIGAGLSYLGLVVAKCAAGAAVPAVMSSTGTVVAGVGTFHGAVTAVVASFAATPISWPLAIGAAGVGYFAPEYIFTSDSDSDSD
jgi:hypothetical protein